MEIDMLINETVKHVIYYNGASSEFMIINKENEISENFFKEFSKIEIETRADEIRKDRRCSAQVVEREIELEQVIDKKNNPIIKDIEKYYCYKYEANYRITTKKFKKEIFVYEKDLDPFLSYFKEACEDFELYQSLANKSKNSDEKFIMNLIRGMSISTMKKNTHSAKIYTSEQYPLDYDQLFCLFGIVAHVSPIISRLLEFLSHSKFKEIGFPLKLRIPIYSDTIVRMSLKNLNFILPKVNLAVFTFSKNLMKPKIEESKNEVYNKNSNLIGEDYNDEFSEHIESDKKLKDFADHGNVDFKSLKKMTNHRKQSHIEIDKLENDIPIGLTCRKPVVNNEINTQNNIISHNFSLISPTLFFI